MWWQKWRCFRRSTLPKVFRWTPMPGEIAHCWCALRRAWRDWRIRYCDVTLINLGMFAAGLLYPLAQAAEGFFAVNAFAPIKPFDAFAQPRFQFLAGCREHGQAGLLVLLEPAQAGADDFAGCLVEAAA